MNSPTKPIAPESPRVRGSFYRRSGKRCFDAIAAFFGLLVLLPVFLLVGIVIKLTSRGPAFFRQLRVGRLGKPFYIFKFRTMVQHSASAAPLLTAAGDSRITPAGKSLRTTKIDELPQLINVLLGEMSIVGPRPEVPKYTADYTDAQKAILWERPGITGPSANVYEEELLAVQSDQESYYVSTILPAKLAIDLQYCENISFFGDITLIFQTFVKIFTRLHSGSKPCAPVLKGGSTQSRNIPGTPVSASNWSPIEMKKSLWFYSRTNQAILDGATFAVSLTLAYLIRFEGWPDSANLHQLLLWLPLVVCARVLVHFSLGIYRQIWKFVSFSDVIEIARSLVIVSAALALVRLFSPAHTQVSDLLRVPLSVIALEGLLSLLGSSAIRAIRRLLYSRERRLAAVSGLPTKRVLLYGAGRAGIMLRKELETNRLYEVAGFVDDDPRKLGSVISKTRVVGTGESLSELVEKYRVDEIIISMATASRLTLAQTLAKCRRANVPAKIIPSLQEILTGAMHISQLRETRVDEVLGRESVAVLDFEQIAGPAYFNKRVLVTGAGGSIGSELVRQVVRLEPSSIAILDKDENSIYDLQQELRRKGCVPGIDPLIADVRDIDRLRSLFARFQPQVVFHAAAHKHVPLMELHPCEAVINNVGGTKNVLEVAEEFCVERFVFISSDKAVNPVNVMGATKRIGEMLVQASGKNKNTRFACVRFGNVLGSRGSVVPLFQRQIAEGGPVTVTHPDVVRYFMTIPEAVQLILCAGTLAMRGEIFVLDMGTPRNILELAREMILLTGLEPEKDIHTQIVGLRPGEKLNEEIVASCEQVIPTHFDKLSFIEPPRVQHGVLMNEILDLIHTAKSNDPTQLLETLSRMDLGFTPQHSRAMAASGSD
jgi:FlaA1/EpsC-like NDP-sugar epimerase/lipopolysaccharide/colanic/teichoic acid biosynthesis glycosyltransferase